MNIDEVKNLIKQNLNRNIEIKVFGMRNKNSTYVGHISNVYPAIFTVNINGIDKSFNYVDVLTGEVKIKYL
jgi:uncharacterized protein Veg